jgi:hypothetical protein
MTTAPARKRATPARPAAAAPVRRRRRAIRPPRPRVVGAWLLVVTGACFAAVLVTLTIMLVMLMIRTPM